MITVAILVNGNPILTRSAVRQKNGIYKVDDGTIIKHEFDDGAAKLAIKMLETVKWSPKG